MLGGHAQSIINAQAVSRADVVVAFFDARLGTETPEEVSGTAEEISRAHRDGKPVHAYFSNEAVQRGSVDPEQLQASEWAGHNSVAFMLTRYGGLFEDGSDEAVDRLDALLSGRPDRADVRDLRRR
jgi:nucleoside 2-deoxyribosyltransferase